MNCKGGCLMQIDEIYDLNVLNGLQMCWKSYKSTATSTDCFVSNQYSLAVGFLNIYQFWQSAAVLGRLVKNDQVFCNQARIQAGSWAQSSGRSHGTMPPPQALHDLSALYIMVMLPIDSCYYMRDLLAHSLGVLDLLPTVESGWTLRAFKFPVTGGTTERGWTFHDPAQFICVTAVVQS